MDLIKSKVMTKWLAFVCIFNSKYAKFLRSYTLQHNVILSEKGKVKINSKGRGFEEIKYGETILELEPNE